MHVNAVVLSCTVALASGLFVSHSSVVPNVTAPSQDAKWVESAGHEHLSHKGSKNAVTTRHDVNSSRGETDFQPTIREITGNRDDVSISKVKTDMSSGLILFLGCSLDIYAINDMCASGQGQLVGFTNNFAYMAYCTLATYTLVYVFQPGASAAPYWKDFVGTLTSQQIIEQSSKDMVIKFGREPTAVVVDSSLWDVSNWWQKAGMPAEPYQVPAADIHRWCHTDLPALLLKVEQMYPRSRIALRTPPPVLGSNTYGQSIDIVNAMVSCVRSEADFISNKVYGKYTLIDFNKIVQTFFLHQTGPQLSFYKDVLHPGPQLSVEYMKAVLQWVRTIGQDTAVVR